MTENDLNNPLIKQAKLKVDYYSGYSRYVMPDNVWYYKGDIYADTVVKLAGGNFRDVYRWCNIDKKFKRLKGFRTARQVSAKNKEYLYNYK